MRNAQILIQIGRVEETLKNSGVSSFCMDCIRGPMGGCCQGCSNLGPHGCTNKPLACALWLCSDAKEQFPNVAAELRQIQLRFPSAISHGYRHASLEAEARLCPTA